MQEHPLELITLEQFAKRLNISRSTAYNWLAEGRLVPGRHVVHTTQLASTDRLRIEDDDIGRATNRQATAIFDTHDLGRT